eukprot:1888432-Alexandrium_andersonii.AAC.1
MLHLCPLNRRLRCAGEGRLPPSEERGGDWGVAASRRLMFRPQAYRTVRRGTSAARRKQKR